MTGIVVSVLFWLLSCSLISCCYYKMLARERLPDGTEIFISGQQNCGKAGNHVYLSGRRGRIEPALHHQYYMNRFRCDTILKAIFSGKDVTIMFLTSESKFDSPVTEEDKKFFSMAAPFVDSTNKCYKNVIAIATGYRIYYEGPRKALRKKKIEY